jgi:hypothetical protein
MRKAVSSTLLVAGVLVPCTQPPWSEQPAAGALRLAEKLRAENPRREIDLYTSLMSEHCRGLCLLLPAYPPIIARVLPPHTMAEPVRAPHRAPGGRDWAYERQRSDP